VGVEVTVGVGVRVEVGVIVAVGKVVAWSVPKLAPPGIPVAEPLLVIVLGPAIAFARTWMPAQVIVLRHVSVDCRSTVIVIVVACGVTVVAVRRSGRLPLQVPPATPTVTVTELAAVLNSKPAGATSTIVPSPTSPVTPSVKTGPPVSVV
jgi:hypothetical protein